MKPKIRHPKICLVLTAILAKPISGAFMTRVGSDSPRLPTQFLSANLAPSALGELGGDTEVIPDILAPCNDRPGSHICDPEHLLSGGAFDQQSEALRRLSEVKKISQCPGMGYEVYVALLSVPPEEAHAAAAELGRRWRTLGNSEACGTVVVYAARERVLAVSSDQALEGTVLSPKIARSIERSPFESAEPASADAVVAALVGQLSGVLDGSESKHYVLVQQGAAIVLYGISSIIGLMATGLLVFCLYDIIAHWFHAMRFHTCQNKVKRVHDAFLSREGELSLCPYCVTSVSNQPSSSHVVFLCGHRFHMECANRWFAEEPAHSGRCAICAGGTSRRARKIAEAAKLAASSKPAIAWPLTVFRPAEGSEEGSELSELPEQRETPSTCRSTAEVQLQEKDSSSSNEVAMETISCNDEDGTANSCCQNSMDEAKNFMLHSLHKEYPDIIQQANLDRWCSCHTEIWLSELQCPRYKSIFAKHVQK